MVISYINIVSRTTKVLIFLLNDKIRFLSSVCWFLLHAYINVFIKPVTMCDIQTSHHYTNRYTQSSRTTVYTQALLLSTLFSVGHISSQLYSHDCVAVHMMLYTLIKLRSSCCSWPRDFQRSISNTLVFLRKHPLFIFAHNNKMISETFPELKSKPFTSWKADKPLLCLLCL